MSNLFSFCMQKNADVFGKKRHVWTCPTSVSMPVNFKSLDLHLSQLRIEERCFIAEDHKQVKRIDETPDDPSDSPNLIEQSDSDSETSDHPPPVFVPEGGDAAAQQDEDDESIVPLNAPDEGAPPNIP